MGPSLDWRIELATTAAACGTIACALVLVALIVRWRQGASLPTLLLICGLLAIMLGACAFSIIESIGYRQGRNPVLFGLSVEIGGVLLGLVLELTGLVLRRRAATR